MSESFVKSTIAIDPVKAALTKAELYAVKGQRERAIECLQEVLQDKPDNVELLQKLEKIKAMPKAAAEVGTGSGMLRVVLILVGVIVAMYVFYAFVL